MASPQKENGHTQIANEILDALMRFHLSGYETRVVLMVIRKTYGWKKKEDWISLSQFVLGTGISRPHVCRAIKMLLLQGLITKGGTHSKPLYRFQKDFDRWKELPKGARSHHITKGGNPASAKGGNLLVPKGAHTKETLTKENIQNMEALKKLKEDLIKKKILKR